MLIDVDCDAHLPEVHAVRDRRRADRRGVLRAGLDLDRVEELALLVDVVAEGLCSATRLVSATWQEKDNALSGAVEARRQAGRRGLTARPLFSTQARAWMLWAIFLRPSGPWYWAYIAAMLASSAWAVQMFEVALSRRMCCSRVCIAIRSAVLPRRSRETPITRP